MESDKPFIHALESKRFFIRVGNTDFRWGIDMLVCLIKAFSLGIYTVSKTTVFGLMQWRPL